METILSVQDLQDIAVRCTSAFLTNQISLNESLAKEAADLNLNSEQVKRAVEAVNTLTYLKTLEKSANERTTEFPVADYNEVIKSAAVPKNLSTPENKWDAINDPELMMDKSASFEGDTLVLDFPHLSKKEALIGLMKQAAMNERRLEIANIESVKVAEKLVKLAEEMKQDWRALDKLSYAVEGVNFEKVSRLVFGEVKERRELPSLNFTAPQMKVANDLAALYKEAENLVSEIQKRRLLQKEAKGQLDLVKQAGLASFIAGGVGKAIGSTVGAIAKLPFRAAGAVAKVGVKKGWNTVADTGVGRMVGMNPKPVSASVGKRLTGVAALGGAALDAAMYEPKANPMTGNGGDVWKKLHG